MTHHPAIPPSLMSPTQAGVSSEKPCLSVAPAPDQQPSYKDMVGTVSEGTRTTCARCHKAIDQPSDRSRCGNEARVVSSSPSCVKENKQLAVQCSKDFLCPSCGSAEPGILSTQANCGIPSQSRDCAQVPHGEGCDGGSEEGKSGKSEGHPERGKHHFRYSCR